MKRFQINDADIERAKAMRNADVSWEQIGQCLGFDSDTIRKRLDPEWDVMRREKINTARRGRPRDYEAERQSRKRKSELKSEQRKRPRLVGTDQPATHFVRSDRFSIRPTEEEYKRGRRAIPSDTRDLTGRLMGDPLVGRRALDQRTSR